MTGSDPFRLRRVEASELVDLRRLVLRNNDPTQRASDDRDSDATSRHWGGFEADRLVVCGSFYPSTSPVAGDVVTYQLRYLATDADARGRGYARRLLLLAESELRQLGAQQLWANARDTALGFYLDVGWNAIAGSEHLSPETQLPHTVIVKNL